MGIAQAKRMSFEEYLALEDAAESRHEWVGGEMVAMAGATGRHVEIAANLQVTLGGRIREKGCKFGTHDLRVYSEATQQLFYPDLVAYCPGARRREDAYQTLLEPILLVEVSSPSTEIFDRTTKLSAYRRFASLRDYLIVAQDRVRVDHYWREDQRQTWAFAEYESREERILIRGLGVEIGVGEIYEGLE